MMKLVISFDEIDPDFEEFSPMYPEEVLDAKIVKFLADQFHLWDIDMQEAFPNPPEYDFSNKEITLLMSVK